MSYSAAKISFVPDFFAFLSASLSMLLLVAISSVARVSKKNIILVGMAMSFLFSSLNSLLEYYASPEVVYQIASWTQGTLSRATIKDGVILFAMFFVCLLSSGFFARDLGIILQGERVATMHGVNVNVTRIFVLAVCSLLSSCAVSVIGIVGFIGLVAPHFARLLKFQTLKEFFVSSALIGAALLLLANDICISILYPAALPVSAVLSLLGIPFLIILVFKKEKL